MLPIDIPTREDVLALSAVRRSACVSIYLETTPVTGDEGSMRIAFANAVRDAMNQLDDAKLERGERDELAEHFDDLSEDDTFWAHQAVSLAILATPTTLRTYRLANRVKPTVQVSDRFHLKPILRALTFAHTGFILSLSQNHARLVEFFADQPPVTVPVPNMPKSAADAVHKASINDRSHSRRIAGSEGKKVRLRQYARLVDGALRPVLSGHSVPLLVAANPPLGTIFQSVSSYANVLPGMIEEAVDRLSEAELSASARPVLDALYADQVAAARDLFAVRDNQGRATSDLSTAAHAGVRGAIETLMIDMDAVVAGTIND
ncbi:MAG: hypothetical protein AAGJ28_22465, partial [Pseudomonadota bacterium]